MNQYDLQVRLQVAGFYHGKLDGIWGPQEKEALRAALTVGPDTKLTDADYVAAGRKIGVEPAVIKAVKQVEASGAGFLNGLPTILFEPHRFSKTTHGAFDSGFPAVSYPRWGQKPYPATQAARYDQLLEAVGLNPDAGFMSASFGLFQILGENYTLCDFATPYDFVLAQSRSEADQLQAFCAFVKRRGLIPALQGRNWPTFAAAYNGTRFRENQYDTKLRDAYAQIVGGHS